MEQRHVNRLKGVSRQKIKPLDLCRANSITKALILLASSVTITNSLVSTTSTVLAIPATNDLPGIYVSNVVCNNGSFTINLSGNNTIDSGFLVNWIVFN